MKNILLAITIVIGIFIGICISYLYNPIERSDIRVYNSEGFPMMRYDDVEIVTDNNMLIAFRYDNVVMIIPRGINCRIEVSK